MSDISLTVLNNMDVFVLLKRCRVCNCEQLSLKGDEEWMSQHAHCAKFYRMAKELVSEYRSLYSYLSNRGFDDDDLVLGMRGLENLVKHGYWSA